MYVGMGLPLAVSGRSVMQVVGPLLHEFAAPVEEVASLVGGFDSVVVDVGQCEFADLAGCVG